MIIARVDWKRDGLAVGSNTDALDWNDWNSPLMSRLNAKLLRNRTYFTLKECHARVLLTYKIRYRSIE
jgi:hypothetical protein